VLKWPFKKLLKEKTLCVKECGVLYDTVLYVDTKDLVKHTAANFNLEHCYIPTRLQAIA
jgi:hypothetical protein